MDDEVMAALVGVLEVLWRGRLERPDKVFSLARLSKRSGHPMSVLRRQLLMLAEAGWVELTQEEGGVGGTVRLSDAGLQLGHALFNT